MKDREVQSESGRKRIEQRLLEVDVLYEALKEKTDALETANTALVERNNYLEDQLSNQRKEQGGVFEENCFLKTKMMAFNKTKKRGGTDLLDLSGSDINNYMHEDYQKLEDENNRLSEEVDILRKRIYSMKEDAKSLVTQVQFCNKNKELRSRTRSSLGPRRGSVGGDEMSRMQLNLDSSSARPEAENPDLLNIIFSQAKAIEGLSSR
jgi:cell division septum initiation protein DivIVA